MQKITILDTTLRDGDQASGFHFLKSEKVEMAKQLSKLGVDVIEAGFACSSQGDFDSIYSISKELGEDVIICSLSRAADKDIEQSAKALEPAKKKRIHTFIATSDIHINGKLKKDRNWVTNQAVKAVRKAKNYVNDVEFSCEDFGRSNLNYVVDIVSEAIKAGATTINLPDTVGFLTPNDAYFRVKYVIEKIKENYSDVVFSVHNHNDLGMATANTLHGILAGARQVEVTINGIGERAGNTALEEIVAILRAKDMGYYCNVNAEYIAETSAICSRFTGITPQPNKAITGKNAFSHEAGIHQDGMIKDRNTYEIIIPEEFGYKSKQTFGPRSGRNALREKYGQLGLFFTDGEFERVHAKFKSFSDDRKLIYDDDLIKICKSSSI